MIGPELGVLEKLSLKEIWLGEATHFTPWLAQNLEKLGNQIGMELELEATEASAGNFSADIVAREIATNKIVIIENQFGRTDHGHLGQLITYASVLGASVIIWIAEELRPEHKSAVDFLNHNFQQSLKFYALEASLVRIENSKPAFLLELVSEPTEPNLVRSGENQAVSETKEKYRQYFQSLIDELRDQYKFTNARTGQPQNWYSFSSENSKIFKYGTSFSQRRQVRVEVYLDCENKEQNEAIFDCLMRQKSEIESQFGSELKWERLDKRRACRVAIYRDGDIETDSDTLADIRIWAIQNLLKLKAIFPQHIQSCLHLVAKPYEPATFGT